MKLLIISCIVRIFDAAFIIPLSIVLTNYSRRSYVGENDSYVVSVSWKVEGIEILLDLVSNNVLQSFQAQELRKYFKSLGAEISEEKSPKGIEDDLHKIVGVCDVCFKEPNEAEIEAILNSIVSIMVSVSFTTIDKVL